MPDPAHTSIENLKALGEISEGLGQVREALVGILDETALVSRELRVIADELDLRAADGESDTAQRIREAADRLVSQETLDRLASEAP